MPGVLLHAPRSEHGFNSRPCSLPDDQPTRAVSWREAYSAEMEPVSKRTPSPPWQDACVRSCRPWKPLCSGSRRTARSPWDRADATSQEADSASAVNQSMGAGHHDRLMIALIDRRSRQSFALPPCR